MAWKKDRNTQKFTLSGLFIVGQPVAVCYI